jgi:PAS domain S-box-containing protein
MQFQSGEDAVAIHVLLVDDEENQIELAVINLENSLVRVTATSKPSQALILLADQTYDCVVSDYQMPEMNGIQLCAEIRKKSSIPFIIYTGRGSEEVASSAFTAGVDDYVRKEETLAHYHVLAKRIRHVVEKRRAEENLREAVNQLEVDRGLLESVVTHASVGINLVRGSDLTYQLVNPFYQAIAPGKEMLGKTIREVWHEIYPQLEEIYNHVLQTGEPYQALDEKFRIRRRPDGPLEEAYFSWSLIRVPLQGQSGWGVLNTVVETTERIRTEDETRRLSAAVREENEKLSALVNSIQDEVWFADLEGRFTLANPSALKEFGITSVKPGIDVGKMAANLEVYRPDGRPRPVEEAPPLRALKGEMVRNQEEIIKTPGSGELRYREVNAAPVRDADGRVIGSVSVVRDITSRKRAEEALRESEERYRMIFDRGQIGIAVSDLEGRILITNPAFQRMLGYTELGLQGKSFRELTLDADLPEENRYVSELIEGKRDGYNFEKRYIRRDGESIWVEVAASVLRNAVGEPAFGVAMVLNINDRRHFEGAFKKSKDNN